MPSLNKVLLMGNLTRAPQTKAMPSGVPVCDFGIAVNRRYKTQSGEDREEACFVDLTTFGQLADFCAKNLVKGTPVYVEGKLRYETWQDKDSGKTRSRLRVMVDSLFMLDRRVFAPPQPYGQGNMTQPPYDASAYGQAGDYAPQGGYGSPGGYNQRPAYQPYVQGGYPPPAYGQQQPYQQPAYPTAPQQSAPQQPAFQPQEPPAAKPQASVASDMGELNGLESRHDDALPAPAPELAPAVSQENNKEEVVDDMPF